MPALALRADDRGDDLGAVHHPAKIDAERPVPLLELRQSGRAATIDPGIVAQDVDLAEHLQRLLDCGPEAVAIGNIGLDEMHRIAAGKFGPRLGDMLVAPVRQRDFHPFGEEGLGHAQANAAGPAGDEGHPACQIFHPFVSRARLAP